MKPSEEMKKQRFYFSYPKIIPSDPKQLQWFINTLHNHIAEKVDVDHRVDNIKWLEQIPFSTNEDLADCGMACPHAKELDKALSQYITNALKGPMKFKLDDKLRELQREPAINKRWMSGRQKSLRISKHQTQGDKQKRHMYQRDKLRMLKLINVE